jgi:hypothetical protein
MIDLIKGALPNTVSVGGKAFSIYTDFRVWMRFCQEYDNWCQDKRQLFDFRYLFKNNFPSFEREEEMIDILQFAYPQNILPRGESIGIKILDYSIDADYIYSAFMQQYGIDLIEVEELHWHKFKALLGGLSDSTKLVQIMGYRCYEDSSEKNQQEICKKLRNEWELPQIETEEDREIEDKFNEWAG